jgi:hypothetical protein
MLTSTTNTSFSWNPEHSIKEADAILAAKSGTLKSVRILKDGQDFYVFIRLTWRKEELFLATTRTNKEPRRFRHIGRLVEYIEANYPGIKAITLVLQP